MQMQVNLPSGRSVPLSTIESGGSCGIYVLYDEAEPLRARYVGKTIFSISRRLRGHVREARAGGRTWRHKWIRSVLAQGRRVRIALIDYASDDAEASDLERKWIDAFRRDEAHRLTNLTDGGEGSRGFSLRGRIVSTETREKIRQSKLGKSLSAEHRAAISKSNTGRPCSRAAKEAVSRAHKGKPKSPQTRARMKLAAQDREWSKRQQRGLDVRRICGVCGGLKNVGSTYCVWCSKDLGFYGRRKTKQPRDQTTGRLISVKQDG